MIVFFSPGLLDVFGPLIWSLFGQAARADLQSYDTFSTYVVSVLYYLFLILSVIMLINMLVALLTKTYDNATVRHSIA